MAPKLNIIKNYLCATLVVYWVFPILGGTHLGTIFDKNLEIPTICHCYLPLSGMHTIDISTISPYLARDINSQS
jgi:hypothetical protein